MSAALRVALVVGVAAGACGPSCFAARPFVTDDARIVDSGGCQIESFFKGQRNHRGHEFWFLPACTPRGPVELTLGAVRVDNADESISSTAIAQAKTLLRELKPNDFGFALTLGAMRVNAARPAPPPGWSPYLNAAGSVSLHDDAVVIHANIGSIRDRVLSRTRGTWGLGAEIALNSRLYGIVEGYGQEAERPSRQIGLRFWVAPGRFQIDCTLGLGSQSGEPRPGTWTSVGIRALF